jgi:recombinational DNA repair protein (RecF pathway)
MKGKDSYYLTEGIILKRQQYRETSLLCRCATKDLGIIGIIASGVNKDKSRLTGFFEPFSHLQLELHRTPRAELYNLRGVSLIRNYLRPDLDCTKEEKQDASRRLSSVTEVQTVNEPTEISLAKKPGSAREKNRIDYQDTLLLNAAAELLLQSEFAIGESQDFFTLLCGYLNYYPSSQYRPFYVFLRFVFRFLDLLGISLNASCFRCTDSSFIYFYPQADGFICEKCRDGIFPENLIRLGKETVEVLGNIYHLAAVKDREITRQTVEEIRNVIIIHLANHYNKRFHLHSLNDYQNKEE